MKKPVFFLLTMIICSYISFACANISDYKVMTESSGLFSIYRK